MKRTALFALILVSFSISSWVAAQQSWEYALLIVNPDGYTFQAPDAAADGTNADDFYFNLTGEELRGSTPAVSILSAVGGSGWELVSVDTAGGQTVTYYFKRAY